MNKQCNSYIMGMGHETWNMSIEHSLLNHYWFCSNNLMWCIHNASFNSTATAKKETNLFSYSSFETFVSIHLTKDWEKYRFQYVFMEFVFFFSSRLLSFVAAIEIVEGNTFKKYEIEWFPVAERWRCWWCLCYSTWNMNQMRGFTVNKMRIISIVLVEIWIFHFVHGRCLETVMKRDGGWWHHHSNLTKEMHLLLFSLLFRKCAIFHPFFIIEYIK